MLSSKALLSGISSQKQLQRPSHMNISGSASTLSVKKVPVRPEWVINPSVVSVTVTVPRIPVGEVDYRLRYAFFPVPVRTHIYHREYILGFTNFSTLTSGQCSGNSHVSANSDNFRIEKFIENGNKAPFTLIIVQRPTKSIQRAGHKLISVC